MKKILLKAAFSLGMIAASSIATVANAGYIVANNDEWTLTNLGFNEAGASNASNFINNITNLFTGDQGGNFLAYSNNFGLAQNQLASAVTSSAAGNTWEVNTSLSFDLNTLSAYDGIFFSGSVNGNYPDQQVILDYLNQGGNIYIGAGTGWGGPANEANGWNTVLAAAGLQFQSTYNGVAGTFAATADPLFTNVNGLYFNNGNTIVDLDPTNATTNGEIFFSSNGRGLLAVAGVGQLPAVSKFTPNNVSVAVPEPSTIAIFALGLMGLVSRRVLTNRS